MNCLCVLLVFFSIGAWAGFSVEAGIDFRYKRQPQQYDAFQNYYVVGLRYRLKPKWSIAVETELGQSSSQNGNLRIAEREYSLLGWGSFHLPKMRFIQSSLGVGLGGYFIDLDTQFAGETVKRRGDLTSIFGLEFATQVDFQDLIEGDASGFFGVRLRGLTAEGFLPSPQWSILVVLGTRF